MLPVITPLTFFRYFLLQVLVTVLPQPETGLPYLGE